MFWQKFCHKIKEGDGMKVRQFWMLLLCGIPLLGNYIVAMPPASAAANAVPEWAKTAVWYQIFPERFANGDTRNDPKPEDMADAWPYFIPEGWQNSPWTSDWFKLQPWEQGIPWHVHFDWAKPDHPNFYATAGLRRYGGDLQGVLDRLDYLQALGITAIYFNPLFESPSLHKYDATLYHHIDNNFGPDPAGDREMWMRENPGDPATWQWTRADRLFLKLVAECHRRGMKIILDGVFNHTGHSFWAFRDVVSNQQASAYRDWYIVERWDDPATPADEFAYQGWSGVKDLPEVWEDENGPAPGFRAHVQAVVRRWMDPNGDGDPADGIDGWRLDVAERMAIPFWREFRQWVREINPRAYLTGEVWWEDWNANKMFNAAPWFVPGPEGYSAFDAVMNYRTARAIKHFAIDRQQQVSARAFADSLRAIYRDYSWDNVLVCMNLMDSHDVDRLASQIVNPDRWFDHAANPSQNENYDVRKPTPAEYRRQKLVAGIQLTLPGAPMIYYGDEAGMWGGDDPDCRKPMIWPELSFEPETHHPLGKTRPADSVAFDADMFAWYQTLIALRKATPALSLGQIEFLDTGQPGVAGYVRRWQDQSVIVLANRAGEAVAVTVALPPGTVQSAVLKNLISGETVTPGQQHLGLRLKPLEIAILQ